MPLLVSARDISLFTNASKELINRIIDTRIDYYKLALNDMQFEEDIYGDDGHQKVYYTPVRIPCLISRNDQEYNTTEMGIDLDQVVIFTFLKSSLEEIPLVPEIGDIVEWNNSHWEIDSLISNQLISGKNPQTEKSIGPDFGSDFSIVANAHMARVTKLNLTEFRTGNN